MVNPYKLPSAYYQALDILEMRKNGLSHVQISKNIGCSKAWVGQLIRYWNLIPEIRAFVDSGQLSISNALRVAHLNPEEQKDRLSKARLFL